MRKRKRLLTLLALLTAAAGAWAQATATTSATRTGSDNTYTVKMKEGTKDAAKWTIASDGNSTTGDKTEGLTVAPEKEVTLTYSGRLKVKSVTATHDGWDGDLSNIPASAIASDGHTVTVPDGTTLTGTLKGYLNPYKIVIPAGAKVTLAGATIDLDELYCNWAGINCEGDATIILADGTTNEVNGCYINYPGIHVAEGKTLIIKGESEGSGILIASGRGGSCGIGAGIDFPCGNIDIQGGVITANGGRCSAGIGGSFNGNCGDINISGGIITAKGGSSGCAGIGSAGEYETNYRCGNITISGGTIVAYGNDYAAGIGCGDYAGCGDITISGGSVTAYGGKDAAGIGRSIGESYCGDITITSSVSLVSATKGGSNTETSIGLGYSSYGCGTVKPKSGTGTVYYDGHGYQNGGDVYLAQSTLTLVNLGKLTSDYEAPNGTTLFGTLNGSEQPYKVSIADGATVTLDGVDINGVNDNNCYWAGLTCAGDATIILKDGSENTVKGFDRYYPGIFVPEDKTLIITSGTTVPGKLSASPFDGGKDVSEGAGIGGGNSIDCGSIEIQGGIITANGGFYAAGIGGGLSGSWGDITISGGKVTSKGGDRAAGIGSGRGLEQGQENIGYGNISITGGTVEATGGNYGAGIGCGCGSITDSYRPNALCGDIFISGGSVTATGGDRAAAIGIGQQYSKCGIIAITTDVNIVTATKGSNARCCIGKTDDSSGNSCGLISIGCTLDNGYPVGGFVYPTGVTGNTFTYQPSH